MVESYRSVATVLGTVNSNIQGKIMETLNVTTAESCRHAGQKASNRKGRNNRIAQKMITVIDPAQDGGLAGPDTEDTQAQLALFPTAGTA